MGSSIKLCNIARRWDRSRMPKMHKMPIGTDKTICGINITDVPIWEMWVGLGKTFIAPYSVCKRCEKILKEIKND